MKFTTFIAAEIIAFIAVPTQALPFGAATLNQANGIVGSLDPIPIKVSVDGLLIPDHVGMPVTDTTTTGLPFESHPDNLEEFPHIVNNLDGPIKAASIIAREKLPHAISSGAHRYKRGSAWRPWIVEQMAEAKKHNKSSDTTHVPHHPPGLLPHFKPWGFGQGPVTRPQPDHNRGKRSDTSFHDVPHVSGVKKVAIAPEPLFLSGNRTGQFITIPFHRVTPTVYHISPRDLEPSLGLSNMTSFEGSLKKHMTCMNEPITFEKVLAHMEAVAEAASRDMANYQAAENNDNITNVIIKGLQFKVGEELGIRILDLQQAQMIRYRLCKALQEQANANSALSRRDVNSADLDAAQRHWAALETQAVHVASETSDIDPAAFNFQRLVIAMGRRIHSQIKATISSTARISTSAPNSHSGSAKFISTGMEGPYPEFLAFKDHIIATNIITDAETKEAVMRTIEEALEAINSSIMSGGDPTNKDLAINNEKMLHTRSRSMKQEHPTDSTEGCKKDFFTYVTGECRDYRVQNRIHHEDILKQAFRHQEQEQMVEFNMGATEGN